MSATSEAGLPEAGRPLLTTVAITASCVAFVVIGALQALYGPAIPALREEFGISPAVAGLSLSAHFVGALLGVLIYHVLRGRLNNRVLLGGSYLLMAAGAAVFAFSPSWNLALTGTFVIGLGFGGIDYGLNQLFAIGFGRRSTAMLNLLNGHFGVGAIAGPALIGWLGADRYPQIFLGVGVVCLLILVTLGGVAAREPEPPRRKAERLPEPGCCRSSPCSSASTCCTWPSKPASAAGNPPTSKPSDTAPPPPPPRPPPTGRR